MSQCGGPMFEMAQQQFHAIADHLEIPDDERNRLILPKHAITVCPIHMDDGRGSGSSAILLDKGRGDGSPWTRARPFLEPDRDAREEGWRLQPHCGNGIGVERAL